jgi:hypothetical protein
MKQYRITTQNAVPESNTEDCYLPATDPVHELKLLAGLGGLGSAARLHEYNAAQGSNISATGNDKAQLQRDNNIKPGTPEWFKLWFSRPYLTGEKPI